MTGAGEAVVEGHSELCWEIEENSYWSMLVIQSGGHRAATQNVTELLGESCGATNECLKEMVRPG